MNTPLVDIIDIQDGINTLCNYGDRPPSEGGLSLADIKELLRYYGLPDTGRRSQLVERLCSHVSEPIPATAQTPPPIVPLPNRIQEHNIVPHAFLEEADLSGLQTEMQGLNLTGAYLHGSNFTGTNLQRVNFTGADLSNATFRNADLSDANLQNTNIDGTSFYHATLHRTNFSEAEYHEYKPNFNLARIDSETMQTMSLPLTRVILSPIRRVDQQQQRQQPQQQEQQQPQQQSQQQEQQQEQDTHILPMQTSQEFEETSKKTNKSIITKNCRHKISYPIDDTLQLVIQTMEDACARHIMISDVYANDIKRNFNYLSKIPVKWTISDTDHTLLPSRYYAHKLYETDGFHELRFKLDDPHNVAIDEGGVANAVFTRAGEYLSSILEKRDEGDRYYIKSKMSKTDLDLLASCIVVSFLQGRVLGLPLSYGLIYCIQRKAVPSLDDMKLSTLMAIYREDNLDDFNTLLKTITKEGIQEALIYYGRNDLLLPKAQEEHESGAIITMQNRFEWLRRVLYDKLFRYKKHLSSFIGYLEYPESNLGEQMEMAIHQASLDEIASMLGLPLNPESMKNLKIIMDSSDTDANIRILEYIKDYLRDNEKNWAAFLQLATGSIDPTKEIHIIFTSQKGHLPVGHSCYNQIEMYPYKNYKSFSRDLDITLSNYEGFGMV